jgi:DNA-binding transcriptional ArsR family regulator
MEDVVVIDDPAAAGVSLDPVRARLLAELVVPGSATTLATKLQLPRQKLNYHLRALEKHGLVQLVEERKKGNCTERVLQASASAYVISPQVLGGVQPDPSVSPDGLSARWLLALAARTLREVGLMLAGARRARRKLATFAMDGEIRFASAADRAAFADELSHAMRVLVAKYHDESAPGGRSHRLLVAVHPKPTETVSGSTTSGERR